MMLSTSPSEPANLPNSFSESSQFQRSPPAFINLIATSLPQQQSSPLNPDIIPIKHLLSLLPHTCLAGIDKQACVNPATTSSTPAATW